MAGCCCRTAFLNRQFDRVYSGLYYQIKPLVAGEPGGQISHSLFDLRRSADLRGKARGAHLWLCARDRKIRRCV